MTTTAGLATAEDDGVPPARAEGRSSGPSSSSAPSSSSSSSAVGAPAARAGASAPGAALRTPPQAPATSTTGGWSAVPATTGGRPRKGVDRVRAVLGVPRIPKPPRRARTRVPRPRGPLPERGRYARPLVDRPILRLAQAFALAALAWLLVTRGPFGFGAAPAPDPVRVAETSPVQTTIALAERTYGSRIATVLIASVEAVPDALAAAGLAGAADAPLILTEPGAVSGEARDAILRLGVERAFVLGGASALSPAVEQELEEADVDVVRLSGPTRFDTAAVVADALAEQSDLGRIDGRPAAVLASGENLTDALAAAPLVSSRTAPLPVLLLQAEGVPGPTLAALERLDVRTAVVVGGESAVPEAVVEELSAAGYAVRRVAGPSRFETAHAVAALTEEVRGFAPPQVTLVGADDPAAALAAGPVAGAASGVLALVPRGDDLGAANRTWLRAQCGAVRELLAVGPQDVVTDAALAEASGLLGGC